MLFVYGYLLSMVVHAHAHRIYTAQNLYLFYLNIVLNHKYTVIYAFVTGADTIHINIDISQP